MKLQRGGKVRSCPVIAREAELRWRAKALVSNDKGKREEMVCLIIREITNRALRCHSATAVRILHSGSFFHFTKSMEVTLPLW